MTSFALIAFLVVAYAGLMVTVAAMLVFLDKANKLLRGFRKLAAAMPPYPVIDAETGDLADGTKVEIQPEWQDDLPGRN